MLLVALAHSELHFQEKIVMAESIMQQSIAKDCCQNLFNQFLLCHLFCGKWLRELTWLVASCALCYYSGLLRTCGAAAGRQTPS